jgi:DNA (cytosine-5)-methyltransferase 1
MSHNIYNVRESDSVAPADLNVSVETAAAPEFSPPVELGIDQQLPAGGAVRSASVATSRPTVAGLFAGIGGIEEGFRRAGYRTEMLCEIDPDARAVLRHRFDCEPVPDVRELRQLSDVNILAAGFPCSDLSQAGRTAGIAGRQSGLVGEVFRLLASGLTTEWLLLENVPFMLSLGRGAAMAWLTAELERHGLDWAYRVVDSRAFGLPQRRRRVLLLASRFHDPRPVLLAEDAGPPKRPRRFAHLYRGFYWTEGNRGLGLVLDAVPPLKNGSTLGIASPPAIWAPRTGRIFTPDLVDAERLQGFAPEWTRVVEEGGDTRAAGRRWRLVGNAVSVPVAEWVAGRLGETLPAHDPSTDEELRAGAAWPRAAWGRAGRRWAVRISEWPKREPTEHLHTFLTRPGNDLSRRATLGFSTRLAESPLRAPAAFRSDLTRHTERLAG